MARRSDHNREQLKEMAINAGLETIVNGGLSAFSARKVAKQIGYTVGTLYNIFKDLDDFIIQINLSTLHDLSAAIIPKNSKNINPEQELINIGKHYINFAFHNFNRWNALFLHQVPNDRRLPNENYAYILQLHNYLVKTMLKIAPFKQEEAEINAKILWSSIHGICMLGITQKLELISDGSLQLMAETLVKNQLIGMKQKLNS